MESESGVLRQETSALSANGTSWLRVVVWLPPADCTRRGIVQLVHGMAEHIERYDAFSQFLASMGYVTFGHDCLGHGKTASDDHDLGHLPLCGGRELLVDDVERARCAACALIDDAPSLPLFMFGHSMGSFVARLSARRAPEDLMGVVLCGTGDPSRARVRAGRALARLVGAMGEDRRVKLLDSLILGPYRASVDDALTDDDWLCTDPDIVAAYEADPRAGQMLTAGGYATLLDLVYASLDLSAFAIPPDLPLLFVSGAEDPVGEMGEGVRRTVERYRDAGVEDVRAIVYPMMRHEILDEPRRTDVYADVEAWLTEHVVLADVATSALN